MTDQHAGDLVSVPEGGGAISAIGDTFQPDSHTGTGNLTVPLQLPAGRNGLQPSLSLSYSTGSPNGPFGLGWSLSVPGVRRRTDKGVPRFDPGLDTFVLSGAEELVPVSDLGISPVRYRPRSEAGYARITHVTGAVGDFWEVWSTDGLRSRYGTPRPQSPLAGWRDPAIIADRLERIFAWLLAETVDPLGNRIVYRYLPDPVGTAQTYLAEIDYGDYGDRADPKYLIAIKITYGSRPDPFSDRRPGFELRTTQRATAVEVWSQPAPPASPILARRVELSYADQTGTPSANSVSLLTRITVIGHDGQNSEQLPPLELGYSKWDPGARRYHPMRVRDAELPATSLAKPGLDLVDLFGEGLPSVLELNGTARYWRNKGDGEFDQPRSLAFTPAGIRLGESGVQLADLDGDGRADLLVSNPTRTGYWRLAGNGGFDPRGYVAARRSPSFGLSDPLVRLIDLDGDGVVDALRTGTSLELFYNDRHAGFQRVQVLERNGHIPDVTFGDPRVFLADMTGDGLTDIVLLHNGNLTYWPYEGYGTWGPKVVMRKPPRFADAVIYDVTGFDPRRLLMGDVDGDGCADVVYVGNDSVTAWINQAGNGFADPVVVPGTPRAAGAALRLADMDGTGTPGVLWTFDLGTQMSSTYKYLDLTGGIKPYLLTGIDNHAGATTEITYSPSTRYSTDDRAGGSPWKTMLPFPVQVVAQTVTTDYFSQTSLTSEYRYHHGYWDGADREFRGFARVDRRDTLVSSDHGAEPFYSPPTETRTWFHPGPVGPECGNWRDDIGLAEAYWQADLPLDGQVDSSSLPRGMDHRGRRYAVRAMRGQVLRSELYALDDSPLASRPYEVTDYYYTIAPILDGRNPDSSEWQSNPVVAVRQETMRTSTWERGDEAMTSAVFTGSYDDYGRHHAVARVAVPRGRNPRETVAAETTADRYLTMVTVTDYATRDDDGHYLVDRLSAETRLEVPADGGADLISFGRQLVANPPPATADTIRSRTVTYHDGPAYIGLPTGQLGEWGLTSRVQRLAFTSNLLDTYQIGDQNNPPPPYLQPGTVAWTADYPSEFQNQLVTLAGYTYEPPGGHLPACWYIEGLRLCYDVQESGVGRGLRTGKQDQMGNTTTLGYDDPFQLLPTSVTDSIGLTRSAAYDYRLLRPSTITDVNGNQTIVGYTPLGLPAWIAALGALRDTPPQGDTTDQPGTSFEYGLLAWDQSLPAARQPIWVHTSRRIEHRWTLVNRANAERTQQGQPPLTDAEIAAMFPINERDLYPERFMRKQELSDGLGRLLQSRTQADSILVDDLGLTADFTVPVGPALTHQADPTAPPPVTVSGWQTYDKKGRVVEKYEPSSGTGWDYQPPLPNLAKVTIYYDPRGLAVRTIYPDGSEQLIVPGIPPDLTSPARYRPTAWETYKYDGDDNAGRTHPSLSAGWTSVNTPSSIVVDALGRTIQSIARTDTATLITASRYDIDGNLLAVTDALGRVAASTVYDLLARRWLQQLLDAGIVRTVLNAVDAIIERRDDKGALDLAAYDPLQRLTQRWARDRGVDVATLREVIVYGDDQTGSGIDRGTAAAAGLLGEPYRSYDEAGRVETSTYDLDGNLLTKIRRTLAPAVLLGNTPGPGGDWSQTAYTVDWQPPAGQTLNQYAETLLDSTEYTVDAVYDAARRPTAVTCPVGSDGNRKIIHSLFGRAGALNALDVDGTSYLKQVLYNPKGQRMLARLGGETLIRYVYDRNSFRLARLRSEPTSSNAGAYQDQGYTYDLVGNLLAIDDRTPGSGVPPNPDRLARTFTYDPLYRLITATGRECDLPVDTPWMDQPRCADLTRVRNYDETYAYDDVGNLQQLVHHSGPAGFTRTYTAQLGSDRLATLAVGPTTSFAYTYDDCGNLLSETTSRLFEWDHSNRLATYRTQPQGAVPSKYAQYRYDSSGQRVLKIVRDHGGSLAITTYIDGIFERVTIRRASKSSDHDRIHLLDGAGRIAIIQVGQPIRRDPSPPVAYHLGDYLGSSSVILDALGDFFNREEYTPYGETSFGSYAKKRYRFTGKERDEESGLAYHGARYYVPWLCRWASCDPAGHKDGFSLYLYVGANPTGRVDLTGKAASYLHEKVEADLARAKKSLGVAADIPPLALYEPLTHDQVMRKLETTQSTMVSQESGGATRMNTFDNQDVAQARQQLRRANNAIEATHIVATTALKVDWELAKAEAFAVVAGFVLRFAGEALAADMVAAANARKYAPVSGPVGPAIQDMGEEYLAARSQVEQGREVLRGGNFPKPGFKGSAAGESQFWSLKSPLTPGYAESVGAATLKKGSLPDYVIGGTVPAGGSFVTRASPPYGANPGGALEVVVPEGSMGRLTFFHMP